MTCRFIPPYLLQHLATAAHDPVTGACGARTLNLDGRLRARREFAPRQSIVAVNGDEARVIHTAANTENLPGTVARSLGDAAVGDAAVDEAYDSSVQVLDMFADQFGRRSVDGNGATLVITVHYGVDYDNAFWDGSQLVFGDGDGVVFDRFTKPADVMAHEFTHGVTQFTAGLIYADQSGALNESVSDVFAAVTKQFVRSETVDQADWLIGEGLFLPGVNARALRSMLEPGTAYDDPQIGRDPQVGHMANYVETLEDNGGVHINSGIPNRAFALAALAIGGSSWEKAGRVWYDALTGGEVTARSDFTSFAQATINSAVRVFPGDTSVADAIREAWSGVGVLGDAAAAGSPAEERLMDRPSPTSPPEPNAAETVAVRRSGGYAGATRSAELDLNADPDGPGLRTLLTRVKVEEVPISQPTPDRFVYLVRCGEWQLTVPEQDLTPDLRQLVQIVLARGR